MKLLATLILLIALLPACSENTPKDLQDSSKNAINEQNKETVNKKKSEYILTIIEKIPHDENAYTQGLIYHNGYLYESTGQYGESTLRKLDTNGNIINKIDIESKYFAEGITIVDDKIYMLTWMETTCLVFDINSFTKVKEFRYQGQGWGLTNNKNELYISNGSNNIYVYDDNFNYKYYISVYNKGNPEYLINELEIVDDKIFANIYQRDIIAVIDLKTGDVLQEIDASMLRAEVYEQENAEVLNGIAYNSEQEIFYLTGKNWKYIFKAKINLK